MNQRKLLIIEISNFELYGNYFFRNYFDQKHFGMYTCMQMQAVIQLLIVGRLHNEGMQWRLPIH